MSTYWNGAKTLVTGGASFIGSHLVDSLLARESKVRVIDDLSSGSLENIRGPLDSGKVEFIQADLRNTEVARKALKDIDVVFHLAADHGGRGYVDLHQAGPASNLFLDGLVFWEALKAGVKKIVFASSGCVYPNHLQGNTSQEIYLHEDLVKPPYDADNMYGWAKLMAECTLRSYCKELGIQAASCRYFTVYGPRAKENHAVIAMIAKAFVGQDPFEIWGDGTQIRNWTYVSDIVEGTILAGEKIEDGTAVNLGTSERIRVMDAAKMICNLAGHKPKFTTLPDMPTGPLNRVASNSLAKQILGWEPKVLFQTGVKLTYDWYSSNRNRDNVRQLLKEGALIQRKIEHVK